MTRVIHIHWTLPFFLYRPPPLYVFLNAGIAHPPHCQVVPLSHATDKASSTLIGHCCGACLLRPSTLFWRRWVLSALFRDTARHARALRTFCRDFFLLKRARQRRVPLRPAWGRLEIGRSTADQSDFQDVRAAPCRFRGSSSAPTHERDDSATRIDWGLRVVTKLEPDGSSKGLLELFFTATLHPPSAIKASSTLTGHCCGAYLLRLSTLFWRRWVLSALFRDTARHARALRTFCRDFFLLKRARQRRVPLRPAWGRLEIGRSTADQSDFQDVRAAPCRFRGSSSAPTHERDDSATRIDWGLRVVTKLEPDGSSKGLLELFFTATLHPPSAISLCHLKVVRRKRKMSPTK